MTIQVDIARSALRAWHRAARRQYPREAFAYLIGSPGRCGPVITDIWTPRDIRRHNSPNDVQVPHHWFVGAVERAEEYGLRVVGCVHSHPDDEYDGCPSRSDLRDISGAIWGITIVHKWNNRPRVVRTDWYGPVAKVEVGLI